MFGEDPKTQRYRYVKNSGKTRVQEYLRDSEVRRQQLKGGSRLHQVIQQQKRAASTVASSNPVDGIRNSKKEEYLMRLEERVRQSALDPNWVQLNKALQLSEQSHTTLFREFDKMLTVRGVQPDDERGDQKTHAEHKLAYQMAKIGKWKPMTEPEIRETAEDRFYEISNKDEMKEFLIEVHAKSLRAQNKKKQENLLQMVDQIKLQVSLQKIQERRQKEKEIEKVKSKELQPSISSPEIRNRSSSSKHKPSGSSIPKLPSQLEDGPHTISSKSPRVQGVRMASFNLSTTSRFYEAGAFKQPSQRNLLEVEKNSQTKSEFHLDNDLLTSNRDMRQEMSQRSGRIGFAGHLAVPAHVLPRVGKSVLLKPLDTHQGPYKLGSMMEPSAQQITQAPSKSETVLPSYASPQSQPRHLHSPLQHEASTSSVVRVFDGLSHRAPINSRKLEFSPSGSPGKQNKGPQMTMFFLNKDAQQQVARRGPSGLYKVTDILRQQQTKALRQSLRTRTTADSLVQKLFPPASGRAG